MANLQPGPTQPEKEHSLPTSFIDKREEFYANKSNISKAMIIRDDNMLKEAVIQYMVTMDYICNRIKPKIRGKYLEDIGAIQVWMLTCLREVGTGDRIPDEILEDLNTCHNVITDAMVSYGFDQITPTVLNI